MSVRGFAKFGDLRRIAISHGRETEPSGAYQFRFSGGAVGARFR